jgi:hypothetical protein
MKRSIFFILLLAATSIYCQNTDIDNGLVSLGAFFSPNYSYRHLEYDDNMINLVEAREENEKPAFGFNAGISKQVYNSNILSIMPSLCLTIPLFLFFPNTNKEFFLNGDDTPHHWGDADFFNLINKMFNYPMINLNTQFVFYPQSTVGFILSPFIETSINFWDNPRYSYSFAAGISCVLSFNFPSNKNK